MHMRVCAFCFHAQQESTRCTGPVRMNINGEFSERNGVYQGHDLVQKLAVLTRFRMQLHVPRAKFGCAKFNPTVQYQSSTRRMVTAHHKLHAGKKTEE